MQKNYYTVIYTYQSGSQRICISYNQTILCGTVNSGAYYRIV